MEMTMSEHCKDCKNLILCAMCGCLDHSTDPPCTYFQNRTESNDTEKDTKDGEQHE